MDSAVVLKSSYFLIFSNSFGLMLWSIGTALSMIGTPFSLCKLSQCKVFCILFGFLFVLQNHTGFRISRFPEPALDDESTTSLHILFKISCTEASGLFPTLSWRFLYWFPANFEQEQKICVIISTLFCLANTGGIYPVFRSHASLILS